MAKLFINKDIAKDADKAKYWLTGEDSISFTDIQYFMDWMPSDDNHIDVEIHSCGGDCTEGYAIYDALRASGKEISCKVVGQCASMATIILLAAPLERRTAYAHSELLIHSPYYDGASIKGIISVPKLENMIADLTADKEKMLALYIERTGQTREILEAQMETDNWFSPEKAIELGFISSVVPAISAKVEKTIINQKTVKMGKEKNERPTVATAFRTLGVALGVIKDEPEAVGMVITTPTGEELTIEREEGEIQVGDSASPDGEFVLEDGRTVIVQDGVITEIKEPESQEDDIEALKSQIAELEKENEELKGKAKSEDEIQVLATVQKAGGIDKLTRAASSKYVPAGRTQPQGKKKEEEKPVSMVQRKLAEVREKNKNHYQKK